MLATATKDSNSAKSMEGVSTTAVTCADVFDKDCPGQVRVFQYVRNWPARPQGDLVQPRRRRPSKARVIVADEEAYPVTFICRVSIAHGLARFITPPISGRA